ncbi:MAG: primosomal protein N', partial [Acidimicrobiales bacterium]
ERLSRRRVPVALLPEQWPEAAAGGRVVVGARGAAWAPAPGLAGVLVLDGHDDAYKEERNPCWSAWEVAARRAERAGAPCVVVSPCPTVELLAWGRLLHPPRPVERSQWPVVEVVDRRGDDPRSGLVSERLVGLLRAGAGEPGRPLVCVLNRRGRARLLACRACGAVVRCHVCASAMVQRRGSAQLSCTHCDAERPLLCADCGATRLSVLRPGVTGLVEELSALAGVAVAEVSSDVTAAAEWAAAPIVVGTEAALHRVRRAGAVAFLEIDQELTAPRYRAAEQALALIARAGRLVGGRGRVVVQTRLPDHDVLRAAAGADPDLLAAAEAERRRLLRLPPHSALALVSTAATAEVSPVLASAGLAVADFGQGALLVRAPDSATLADALGAATAVLDPAIRASLRVEVDPSRV